MTRRTFLVHSSLAPAALAATKSIDLPWYRNSRKFAQLPISRVAFVEKGSGPAALFLHGYPLNGYQWRGAIERLHTYRRCIVPDLMSLGYTETPEGQVITPATQVEMLAALLDSLHAGAVDLVANDSGGLVAQLFLAKYPGRVRSLLLTNCDVDENNPPAPFQPLIDLAKRGKLAEQFVAQLNDKQLARSARGLGSAYSYPDKLSDEMIEIYFRPLVTSALRKSQLEAYTVALGENVLVPIRERLQEWNGPARMVWGLKDPLFPVQWAEWLDRTLPGSRGIKRAPEGNLFFPEEMPDLIAQEARTLWSAGRKPIAYL
jgi:haloalkane dehalogenase